MPAHEVRDTLEGTLEGLTEGTKACPKIFRRKEMSTVRAAQKIRNGPMKNVTNTHEGSPEGEELGISEGTLECLIVCVEPFSTGKLAEGSSDSTGLGACIACSEASSNSKEVGAWEGMLEGSTAGKEPGTVLDSLEGSSECT